MQFLVGGGSRAAEIKLEEDKKGMIDGVIDMEADGGAKVLHFFSSQGELSFPSLVYFLGESSVLVRLISSLSD